MAIIVKLSKQVYLKFKKSFILKNVNWKWCIKSFNKRVFKHSDMEWFITMLFLPIEIIVVKQDENFYKVFYRSVGKVRCLTNNFSTIELCAKLKKTCNTFKMHVYTYKIDFKSLRADQTLKKNICHPRWTIIS